MTFRERKINWNYNYRRQFRMGMSHPLYLVQVVAASSISPQLAPRKIAPFDAHILLTENCQAKCITCDYWKTQKVDKMSTEFTIRTIDRLGELGFKHLRLAGGEILLRSDLFEILDRSNTNPFQQIRIQTNGLLLNKRARAINESPLTHVSISLDATGDTNDYLRGIEGYYELALAGALKLKGKEIEISCTLTGPGAEHLEALIDLSHSNNWAFSYNMLNNMISKFEQADLSCWPKEDSLEKILEILRRRVALPEVELNYIRKHYTEGPSRSYRINEPPCVLGYLQLYILANGDVLSGCYGLPPIGNIFNHDLEEILHSDLYKQRAQAMLRRECNGCVCNVNISLKANRPLATLAHAIGVRKPG